MAPPTVTPLSRIVDIWLQPESGADGYLGRPCSRPVELRVATVEDANAVATVHVRSWQSAYRGLIPDAYLDALSVERRTAVWRRILTETLLPHAAPSSLRTATTSLASSMLDRRETAMPRAQRER